MMFDDNYYLRCGGSAKMEECCGIFGIFAPGCDVSKLTTYALYALQHRGQESAGIALSDGQKIYLRKGPGLVQKTCPNLKIWRPYQLSVPSAMYAIPPREMRGRKMPNRCSSVTATAVWL
jgi:glutamate synthase domain-containing protein 1